MCITVSRPGTSWKKELSPLDFDPDSSEVHRFSFGRNSSSTNGKRVTYYAFRTIYIRKINSISLFSNVKVVKVKKSTLIARAAF